MKLRTVEFLMDKSITNDDWDIPTPGEKISRYWTESHILLMLGIEQLNQEKNKIKPKFETITLSQIKSKLNEELAEFWEEASKGANRIDFERAFEELGDVAACLTGMLAKLVHIKNNLVE